MKRSGDRLWAWVFGVGGSVACVATWTAVVRADDNIGRDITQAAQVATGRYVAPAGRVTHYTREAAHVVRNYRNYRAIVLEAEAAR